MRARVLALHAPFGFGASHDPGAIEEEQEVER